MRMFWELSLKKLKDSFRVSSQWSVVSGQWSVVSNQLLVFGLRTLVFDLRLSAVVTIGQISLGDFRQWELMLRQRDQRPKS